MVSLYPKAETGNVMMVWVEKLLAAYSGSPTPSPQQARGKVEQPGNLSCGLHTVESTVPSLRLGGATCWQQICLKIRETKPRRSSWRSKHLSIRIIFLPTLDNLLLKARKCDNLPFSDSFLVHKSFTDSMVVGERIRSDEHFVWSNQLLENFPTHHNAMEAGLISDYEVCCSKVWNAPVVPKWHSASAGDRSIISSVSSPSASFSSFSSSLSSHHKGS